MKNIAVFALSAKPYHKTHDEIIRKIASENDELHVFVSTGDRDVISGDRMRVIWDNVIMKSLPANAIVSFVTTPVRSLYTFVGDADVDVTDANTYKIYGSSEDVTTRFKRTYVEKYFPNLVKTNRIVIIPIDVNDKVTGTLMRKFLSLGDKESFIKNLPVTLDAEEYWRLLTKR